MGRMSLLVAAWVLGIGMVWLCGFLYALYLIMTEKLAIWKGGKKIWPTD